MNKKILLLGLVVLGILLCTSLVSAYNPYYSWRYAHKPYYNTPATSYTSWGYNAYQPYQYQPARVGGFYGANSAFITNLRPGIYMGPMMTPWTRTNIASQYYPMARAGGRFGYYPYSGYYYGLRPGMHSFGGYGTGYSNFNYMYHGPL